MPLRHPIKMYRIVLLIIICTIIYSCGQNQVTWTSCSNLFGKHYNIKFNLPNLIKEKSSIEFACQGDPEQLHIYYTCLLGKDTALIEVTTTTNVPNVGHIYLGRDTLSKIEKKDTSFLTMMFTKQLAENKNTKLEIKEIKEIQGHIIYILKYSLENVSKYYINHHNRYHFYTIEIKNLKDQKIINEIVNSISFEKAESFMCF